LYSNTKDTGSNQPSNQQQASIPWKNSQAKVYQREELAKGDPSSHPFWISSPAEVWGSEERFREYSKNNFCNNLRSYRKIIKVQMESICFEDGATKQHLLLFASTSNKNNRGNPRLHNNPANRG
jgi:hypothetical protein